MKTLLILSVLLIPCFISAQEVSEIDSVPLTDLQIQKINAISKSMESLKKQYEEAQKSLELQMSETLIFVLDANGLDPRKYEISGVEGKTLTIKLKPEK